jgi:flagellar protein FlbD
MIRLARLNGKEYVLNAEFIETVEETPDTVVTLNSGKKLMVKDRLDDVIKRVIEYKQLCNQTIQVVRKDKEMP